jgi:hypothetical protein
MRITNQVTKCVGFISRDTEPLSYAGTVFFVGVPFDERSGVLHIVTAKHVADAVGTNDFVIAVNSKDGLPRFMKNGGDVRWFFHPDDESVDVAVMPLASARAFDYDIQHIPLQLFATDAVIAEHGIGLGDEVVIVGLFTGYFGLSRLIPIVRTGNIAMMPDETIPTEMGNMEAYLAEGRSIGGLSGSPVFCRSTVRMPAQTAHGEPALISGLGPIHFLGLMHGHWDLPSSFDESERREAVNMGVSIVVPAKKILEVINGPELRELREKAFQRTAPE